MIQDRSGFGVFLKTATGEIATNDGFDGQGDKFAHEHRARDQVFVSFEGVRQGRQVIGHEVRREHRFSLFEPPQADLRKENAFAGNAVRHHDIEGRQPIGSHDEVVFAEIENFADFTFGYERERQARDGHQCFLGQGRRFHSADLIGIGRP